MSFRMIRTPVGRTPQVPSASSLCIEPNETRLMTAELRCVWADTLLKIKLLHWHRWLKEPLTSTESFQCTKGSLDYLYVVNNTKNMLLLRTDHWRFFGEPEMGLLWHHRKTPLEPLFLGALNPHKRFFRLLKCSSNSFRKLILVSVSVCCFVLQTVWRSRGTERIQQRDHRWCPGERRNIYWSERRTNTLQHLKCFRPLRRVRPVGSIGDADALDFDRMKQVKMIRPSDVHNVFQCASTQTHLLTDRKSWKKSFVNCTRWRTRSSMVRCAPVFQCFIRRIVWCSHMTCDPSCFPAIRHELSRISTT